MWRITSISDLINVLKATCIASLFSISVILLILGPNAVPRTVLLIDYLLTTIGIAAVRASVRIYSTKFVVGNRRNNQNKIKLLKIIAYSKTIVRVQKL